jgi:hypothetical protein
MMNELPARLSYYCERKMPIPEMIARLRVPAIMTSGGVKRSLLDSYDSCWSFDKERKNMLKRMLLERLGAASSSPVELYWTSSKKTIYTFVSSSKQLDRFHVTAVDGARHTYVSSEVVTSSLDLDRVVDNLMDTSLTLQLYI